MILENEWNKGTWDSETRTSRDYTEDELLVKEDDDLWDNFCSESGYYEVPECVCPICQFIEYSEYDLRNGLTSKLKQFFHMKSREVTKNEETD